MYLNEHCARSRELLGQDWREVHIWLDRFERDLAGWLRILLHYALGLELAVATLGEGKAVLAELRGAVGHWGLVGVFWWLHTEDLVVPG